MLDRFEKRATSPGYKPTSPGSLLEKIAMSQGVAPQRLRKPQAEAEGSARPRGNTVPAGGGVSGAPTVTPRSGGTGVGGGKAGAAGQRPPQKRSRLVEGASGSAPPKTVEGLLAEIGRDARNAGRGSDAATQTHTGGGKSGRDAIKAAIKVRCFF